MLSIPIVVMNEKAPVIFRNIHGLENTSLEINFLTAFTRIESGEMEENVDLLEE